MKRRAADYGRKAPSSERGVRAAIALAGMADAIMEEEFGLDLILDRLDEMHPAEAQSP